MFVSAFSSSFCIRHCLSVLTAPSLKLGNSACTFRIYCTLAKLCVTVVPEEKSHDLWPYKPLFALAWAFGAAFSISFFHHAFQYIRLKASFLYFILVGVLSNLRLEPIDDQVSYSE